MLGEETISARKGICSLLCCETVPGAQHLLESGEAVKGKFHVRAAEAIQLDQFVPDRFPS